MHLTNKQKRCQATISTKTFNAEARKQIAQTKNVSSKNNNNTHEYKTNSIVITHSKCVLLSSFLHCSLGFCCAISFHLFTLSLNLSNISLFQGSSLYVTLHSMHIYIYTFKWIVHFSLSLSLSFCCNASQ